MNESKKYGINVNVFVWVATQCLLALVLMYLWRLFVLIVEVAVLLAEFVVRIPFVWWLLRRVVCVAHLLDSRPVAFVVSLAALVALQSTFVSHSPHSEQRYLLCSVFVVVAIPCVCCCGDTICCVATVFALIFGCCPAD